MKSTHWPEINNLKTIVKSLHDIQIAPRSFFEFLRHVTPDFTWDWPYLKYIQTYLQKIERGELKKLMIFCPPRHGKTEMTTLHWPTYLLEKKPTRRVIIAAYNQILANKFSRRIRRLSEGRMLLSKERSAVEEWETEAGGGIRAVGIGGGVTGQGGDIIIIDDPIKNRLDANSKVYRDRIWEWYTDDLYTRLEPNGAMILIMTRWHHDDLAGRILESEDANSWEVISFPAFAEKNDPLNRQIGESLCPDRFDKTDLNRIKAVLKNSFEALYQQKPSIETGSIFKRYQFQSYITTEIPKPDFVLQSWDTAFKTGMENDYSVGTTWYYAKHKYYLVDRWKGHASFGEVKAAITNQALIYNPNVILIEDKASGSSLVETLKTETSLPITPYNPERDKIARAYASTGTIDAGLVYLPFEASWMPDFMDTILSFPYGKHDDDVDSMTMALLYMATKFISEMDTDNFDYSKFNKFSQF